MGSKVREGAGRRVTHMIGGLFKWFGEDMGRKKLNPGKNKKNVPCALGNKRFCYKLIRFAA